MSNDTVTVSIAGREYSLTAPEGASHTQRIAALVDRKMREAAAAGMVNRETAAVIAALSFAEELILSQDENTRLRRQLDPGPEKT